MSNKLKNIEASVDCGVEGVFASSTLFLLKNFPPQDQWREKISIVCSIPLPPAGGGGLSKSQKLEESEKIPHRPKSLPAGNKANTG